jgi:acetoacetate decarboxylase
VEFLTDPEVVLQLLPPPLQPAPTATAVATIGRWQSNCVGDFAGAVLALAAQHDGLVGGYPIAMYMDSEPPVVFGRDFLGEPKKLAESGLFRHGDRMRGWVRRHGSTLLDLSAVLGDDVGASEYDRFSFNFKSRPAAGGIGLQEPAILTRTRFRTSVRVHRSGTGTITLGGSSHDPLNDIPVVSVVRAVYTEDDVTGQCQPVATVSEEDFLPYHYGRMDDWLAFDTAP